LLSQTQNELAELFLANGISIPFSGDPVQIMTLSHNVQSSSNASTSLQSALEFEFITTPGSITSKEDLEIIPCVSESAPEHHKPEPPLEFQHVQESEEPEELEASPDLYESESPLEVEFTPEPEKPEHPLEVVATSELKEPAPALETESLSAVLEEKPKKKLKTQKEKKKEEKKEKKKKEKKGKMVVQAEYGPITQSAQDLPLSEIPPFEILEAPAAQEAKEAVFTFTPIPEEIPSQITMHYTQPLAGQTIVLTIQIGSQTRNTMVNLAENTKTAILKAVNSYLDSNNPGHSRGQRKVEITHGAGKNGDIDLFALEESKWPEYLDYFHQCTGLPELKVEILGFH